MAYEIKRDDTYPPLRATLLDARKRVIPLNGTTVKFFMKGRPPSNKMIGSDASITDADAGKIEYQWQDGDTDEAGVFDAEFQVTYPSGERWTVPTDGIEVNVLADLNEDPGPLSTFFRRT